MKILSMFRPKNPVQFARVMFHTVWHVPTRTIIRVDQRSVSWAIYADLEGTGQIPARLVAGGVADNRKQADYAIERTFNLWTIQGPAGMVGRAGW